MPADIMATELTGTAYHIIIKTPAGIVQAFQTDFLSIDISSKVNGVGLARIKMDYGAISVPYYILDAQVDIYRVNLRLNIPDYIEFTGLFRKKVVSTDTDGRTFFEAHVLGIRHILTRRIVAYPGNFPGASLFTNMRGETIMKTIVYQNLIAHTGFRANFTNSDIAGVSNETDGGRGPLLDWKCPWKNGLTELVALSKLCNSDFDLLKTGANSYQFVYKNGPMGTDRSASIFFSLHLGNMAKPKYTFDATNEATVAIVGGRNIGQKRKYAVYKGGTYDAVTNNIEMWVDARESDTTAYLYSKASVALFRAMARNQVEFEVIQTFGSAYGRDYFLGDFVTAYYASLTFKQKVIGVTLNFAAESQKELITIDLRDTDSGPIDFINES